MTFDNLKTWLQKIAHLLPFILFACALYIVHQQLVGHKLDDILSSLHSNPPILIVAAFALTIINYLVLAGYDWLALRYTGHLHVPLAKMIPAALLSYAISNNTGHAWAAGGSIRYRFYSKWAVSGWDILKIALFQTITYLLGAVTLGLIGSLILPKLTSTGASTPTALHWVSIVCSLTLLIYWAAIIFWRKPLLIKAFSLYLPSVKMTFWQTIVASIDVILSSLVLWVLILHNVNIGFGTFLAVFVVAQVLGVISQVPGGIGVFESAFLWLMPTLNSDQQHLTLIAALLLYRLIYYFMPLLLAGIGLFSYEVYNRRAKLIENSATLGRLLTMIMPQIYSILLFLAGSILIFSGALPNDIAVMNKLAAQVSLPVIEFSHLSGSLIGLVLIILARGIRLKIDVAWYGSVILLCLAIVSALLKGWHWGEALILLLVLVLFLPARSHFQRRSSLLTMPFSKSWLLMFTVVLLGSVWLGFFAYRDVEYAHDLWWQFSYDGNAPRFLRAFLLIILALVYYAGKRLLRVAPPLHYAKPTQEELKNAYDLLAQANHTQGFLALLGDKYLFWNQQRTAFIMFAVTPQFWIAMGDPVGGLSEIESLCWQFQEQADQYGAKATFYQVSPELLPVYLDQGLSLFKLGEEARIDLSQFSLSGKQGEDLRTARNRFNKLNYQFQVIGGSAITEALPRLRQISDAWLSNKHTREKSFSLGFFNEDYLQHTNIAVIKNPEGQIAAFANLWQTTNRQELSVDLMRYDPQSPKGIMDFLFAELMLWGKTEQYCWFSLGMAPLAGLERHRMAPLWHKIGATIFDFSDQFYNFEGLYLYKAKFSPKWQPRYLAAPASLSVPMILMAITRLISGGWQGIFGK